MLGYGKQQWLSATKNGLIKSGAVGVVSVCGMYLGTKEKDRKNLKTYRDYPFCFTTTSALYGLNYAIMRSDRKMAQDMTQPRIFRYMHQLVAFPRLILTHPIVAIPTAFGVGYFFFPLLYTYGFYFLMVEEAREDRERRKREDQEKKNP